MTDRWTDRWTDVFFFQMRGDNKENISKCCLLKLLSSVCAKL